MRFYDTSSSTTTSTYTYYTGTISYDDIAPKMSTKKSKKKEDKLNMIKSIPLRCLMDKRMLSGSLSVFGYRQSPVFKDTNTLVREFGMSTYCNDPVLKGYDSPTNSRAFNYSLIIDALEYMPGTLTRANVVKEAFYTLISDTRKSSVIIVAKSPKMVNDMAERGNYKKLDNGFLIPKNVDDARLPAECLIEGLSVDDLTEIALLAGAERIEEITFKEMEESCIRAYLN